MGKMLVITSDGTATEVAAPDNYSGDSAFRSKLQEIVGGDIEIVWVLFKEERTCMIVNEIGVISEPPLPVNKLATEIYWTATNNRSSETMDDWWNDLNQPRIHGDVAVLHEVNVT